MMSAGDLTVDEERKEQAWTTLFIALGIIPNEESQHYEVTEVNGQLVIQVQGEDEALAQRQQAVQDSYERLRRNMNLQGHLPHTLEASGSATPQGATAQEDVHIDDIQIISGLDFMQALFGDMSALTAAGLTLDWAGGFDERVSEDGQSTLLVSKAPIQHGLMRTFYEELIFKRIIDAICAASPTLMRQCLASDSHTLDISCDTHQPVANPMLREIVKRCFGLLPDGTAFFDYTLLLDLVRLRKMENLSIPTAAFVAFLNQHVPSQTVIDQQFQALLLPPTHSQVAQRKTVVIMADNTGSIKSGGYHQRYLTTLADTIKRSVAALSDADDEVLVIPFGGDKILGDVESFKQGASDHEIDAYIRSLSLGEGSTPLFTATSQVLTHERLRTHIASPNCQASLVVITDGCSNGEGDGAKATLQEQLQDRQTRANFHIFTVGISPDHAADYCQWLAQHTGGEYIDASNPAQMARIQEHFKVIQTLRELFELVFNGETSTIPVYSEPVVKPLEGARVGMQLELNGHMYVIGESPVAAATQQAPSSSAPHASQFSGNGSKKPNKGATADNSADKKPGGCHVM